MTTKIYNYYNGCRADHARIVKIILQQMFCEYNMQDNILPFKKQEDDLPDKRAELMALATYADKILIEDLLAYASYGLNRFNLGNVIDISNHNIKRRITNFRRKQHKCPDGI